MPRQLRVPAIAVATALLLVGCAPAEPAPTPPTPATEPTFQCTPLFDGEPASCSQDEYDELAVARARYDEAAALYEATSRHIEELLAAKQPIDEQVSSVGVGDYLKAITDELERNSESSSAVTGPRKTEWIVFRDVSIGASDMAVERCSSPGTFKVIEDGEQWDLSPVITRVFFTDADGDLKMSAIQSKTVDSS